MEIKRQFINLTIIGAIASSFFDFSKYETILITLLFLLFGILIFRFSKKWSNLKFYSLSSTLILFEIVLFYFFTEQKENIGLDRIFLNQTKLEWKSDDVKYSVSIKNNLAYFYDENEFIEKFKYKINGNEIYFHSSAGENLKWVIIEKNKTTLKIIEDEVDTILIHNTFY